MEDGIYVDPRTLDVISDRLRQAADGLDATGMSAPATPDAGSVTPLMSAVVSHLVENAGQLVVGLREASDRVADSRESYSSQDLVTGQQFQGLF